jgi:hypothetical protein
MLPYLGSIQSFDSSGEILQHFLGASCLQVCSFSISQTEKIKIKIAKNSSNQLKQTHKANQPLTDVNDALEIISGKK